ncbi:MAG: glycoside hydrolase family 32 protein [Gemmatimonadota bacterium]
MNDPNGMVHYDGEYHLFYQYHPESMVWGPMHWGHAVSRDLVRWDHLPVALEPDSLGYIFSGSAVVDRENTSGFGTGDDPPLVAIFTYHDPVRAEAATGDHETQGIAYSTDRGRTWTKWAGNPVLPNRDRHADFRDPNVFWHEETGRWVMALSVHDRIELWGSPDLKRWSFLSEFGAGVGAQGGVWECPDLFPLVDPRTGETRWVLILNLNPGGPQGGSGTQYFIGDFDGTSFTLDPEFERVLEEQEAVWLDHGADNYAGVTWADVPEDDGRRIFIGWMSNWAYAQQVPTNPWRSAMTVPRSLHLHHTSRGIRLRSEPVRELNRLRGQAVRLPRLAARGLVPLTDVLPFPATPSEVELAFQVGPGSDVGVELSNDRGERYRVGFRAGEGVFYSDRTTAGENGFSDVFAAEVHEAPRLVAGDTVRMRLFLDVASAELFADDGATVMTEIFFPSEPFDRLAIYGEGGSATLVEGRVWPLEGIW